MPRWPRTARTRLPRYRLYPISPAGHRGATEIGTSQSLATNMRHAIRIFTSSEAKRLGPDLALTMCRWARSRSTPKASAAFTRAWASLSRGSVQRRQVLLCPPSQPPLVCAARVSCSLVPPFYESQNHNGQVCGGSRPPCGCRSTFCRTLKSRWACASRLGKPCRWANVHPTFRRHFAGGCGCFFGGWNGARVPLCSCVTRQFASISRTPFGGHEKPPDRVKTLEQDTPSDAVLRERGPVEQTAS